MGQVLLIAGIIIAIISVSLIFYSPFVAAGKADETIEKENNKKKTDDENKESKG